MFKATTQGRPHFFWLINRLAITVCGLRQLSEVRRRVKETTLVVVIAGCCAFRVSAPQTTSTCAIGTVDEDQGQEGRSVMTRSPKSGEGRAKHEVAVAGGQNYIALRAG